jgi:hypothetical protein
MILKPIIPYLVLLAIANAVNADTADRLSIFNGGHAKYQLLFSSFPENSLFLDYIDSPVIDHNADLRLKLNWKSDKVQLVSDYQMTAQHGDSITPGNNLPAQLLISAPIPNDKNRLFDLTHVVSQDNDSIYTHRLDRLYISLTGTHAVARLGRQAISWGNGLIYTPMDFFNPFDPASVDKEYKTGDDMLYAQYLRKNGDDLQAVWVVRRNDDGEISNRVDSIASKYHGFIGSNEYDLLISEHYDDTVFAIGGIIDVGEAIWRGDIMLTDTQAGNITSLVTSLSYSWLGWGRNISGIIEYFYNGFGQTDGDYSPTALAANPELINRIIRGELFTLGRHYIAASAMIEITPLWLLTPGIFINTDDNSFLFQLSTTYEPEQDWQLLAALSIPTGARGSEYGGIDSPITGKQLSTELNLLAQLAWYF